MEGDRTQIQVSSGRACARQGSECLPELADLAKFQWKEQDLKGPLGGAVEEQVLLLASMAEPPPWKSWLKNKKAAELLARKTTVDLASK